MKIRYAIFYVLFICLSMGNSYGREALTPDYIDSLNLKAWSMVGNANEDALELSKSLLNMSQSIDYENGVFNALYQLGFLYDELNHFDLSVRHYFKALDYLNDNDLPGEEYKKATLMQSLGFSYEKTSRYEDALDYYHQGLGIALEHDFSKVRAELYLNLGVVNRKLDNANIALVNYLKSLAISTSLQDHANIAKTYNLIGMIYQKNGNYDLAKANFSNALETSKQYLKADTDRVSYINNLGENLFLQAHYDSAQYYYTQALELSQNLGDEYAIKYTSNNLGETYSAKGNYEEAIRFYQIAIAMGDKGKTDSQYRRACKNIAAAYEQNGEYKKAVEYKDRYIAHADILKDAREKLIEENAQNRMKEVEWIIERQAREAKIRHVEAENFWFKVSMTLLFIILAGASYAAFHYYKGIKLVKKWLASDV